MTCAAVIAVKGGARAKTRLARALGEAQRAWLVRAMLERVLTAAVTAKQVAQIVLVTSEPQPSPMPALVTRIADAGLDLSAAYTRGAEFAVSRGHRAVLLLPADLALVTAEDVDGMVLDGVANGAALALDECGDGTNAFYLPAPLPIRLGYGSGSAVRHIAACVSAGIRVALVRRAGLALDVDEPNDLLQLGACPEYQFLQRTPESVQ
jgi:2-phospho-L-lactate guanylyltransferase